MDRSSLGNRMKEYERAYLTRLPKRMPVILRLDGIAFHTWVKKIKADKPFDDTLMERMADLTAYLCNYHQYSDKLSCHLWKCKA